MLGGRVAEISQLSVWSQAGPPESLHAGMRQTLKMRLSRFVLEQKKWEASSVAAPGSPAGRV
jgi:hypothetical protein